MEDKICTNCQSKIEYDEEIGKFVCDCGLEYDELLEDEDEKETGVEENEERNIQMVKPYKTKENEYTTTLLIKEKGKKVKIIRTYSKKTRIDKNFYRIQKLLQGKTSQRMIDETKNLYSQIAENKNMQGKNINHIVIGIYYYVCRIQNVAKTIKEIAKEFRVSDRIIKKSFNNIKFDIVEPPNENQLGNIEKNYINSFIGPYEQKYDLKKLNYDIIDNINIGDILEGKTPETIVGLSLFLSHKLLDIDLFNKEEIYKTFSNEKTLRKAYKEIKDKDCLNLIIPHQYIDKIEKLKNNLFD